MVITVKGDEVLEVWYLFPGLKGHKNSKKCFSAFRLKFLQHFISLILELQALILARAASSPSWLILSSETLSVANTLKGEFTNKTSWAYKM